MFKTFEYEEFGKVLSSLWLFVILNSLFRDMHEMAMASTIREILDGSFNGTPVTEGALLAGAVVVQILLLGMLLSNLLKPHAARLFNLFVPPLIAAAMFLVPPDDLDDYFFYVVMIGALLTISVLAWNWREPAISSAVQSENEYLEGSQVSA